MPSVRIQPAFGGMNSEASPEYVPSTQAAVLENLLPRPGKVVLRGPISADIDTGVALYSAATGSLVFGSNIMIDVNATSLKTISSGVVAAGVGAVRPGARSTRLDDYVYSIRSVWTASSSLVRWDGNAASAAVALTNGGDYAVDITTHLYRLFTLDNSAGPSPLATGPVQLRWSDAGGATADTLAEWQDDVSGLDNVIILGDANDKGVALGHVGRQLAIFKAQSVWLLSGLTPSAFSVTRASSEWGCLDSESVVNHDDGCFFLSERGFAYFDGAQITDVSADIRSELLSAIRAAPLPYDEFANIHTLTAGLRPFARAAAIGRGNIMLTIGQDTADTAVAPTVTFCGIYDVNQRTWTTFSSDALAVSAPIYYITTPPSSYYAGATLGYDGAGSLAYLDDVPSPESASPALGGEDVVDSTTATISGTCYSRIIQLSSPVRTSQLKRLLLDYTFVVVSDADPTISGWSVSLVDGQGNELLAPVSLDASILASGYTAEQRRAALIRKRFQVEVFAEASEVQLRMTLPALDADVTEVIAAEIHDATIEFAPGSDRPTS